MGGMLGNFIAGAAGAAADYSMKSGLQAQLQEAEMAKQQRIEEMRQNFKIADEERGRETAKRAGEEIDTEAKSMVAANRGKKISSMFGGQTEAEFDAEGGSLPEERKMVEPSRRELLEANADARLKKGDTKGSAEVRGMLNQERLLAADEAKGARSDRLLEFQRERAEAKEANDAAKLELMDKKIEAMISKNNASGKAEKLTAVYDKAGNLRVLSADEINKGEYTGQAAFEGNRKSAQAEEARSLSVIRDKEKLMKDIFAPKERAAARAEIARLMRLHDNEYGTNLAAPLDANDPLGLRNPK